MTILTQKTYTCVCGKKHPIFISGAKLCSCGRTATIINNKIQIVDKKKKK